METIFTISNGDKAPDRWCCTCASYQDFCASESSSPLGEAMSLWRLFVPADRIRATNPLEGDPRYDDGQTDSGSLQFRDFNVPPSSRLFKPSLANACEADVSAPSPHDFLWSAPGDPPVRLEDVTVSILQKSLTWDLLVCKELAHPFYHRIEQSIDDVKRRYTRLLLPVADAQGGVCKIYAFCRPLAVDDVLERGWTKKLI